MATNNLSKAEVRDLIYSYEKPEVTNQLYDFGKMLLEEVQSRSSRINSQSVSVLGWSTAILAFLFAGIDRFSGGSRYFSLCSAVFALAAMRFSVNALRTRPDWSWPSDVSWIHKTGLLQEDELKRYHIRVIHDVRSGRVAIVNAKARSVLRAEVLLILSAAALVAGFEYQLLLAQILWFVALAKVI
jgi:hypothetical protein